MIMASNTNTVYVMTGANRGLGLGLTKRLLERPSTTVVASVRSHDAATSLRSDIESVAVGENSTLHIIELDFSTALSPDEITMAFVAAVRTVTHIDVVICNAGFPTPMTPALVTSAEDLRKSFEVNTIAPLLVFQTFWPLMQRSASPPKLVVISSSVGSIAGQEPFPGGAYGPSKAASNWITRALHLQNEADGLVAFALHPGWVQTRAGDFAAKEWGYPGSPPVTVEDSVNGMLGIIDSATRENVSGKFASYTGDILSW
jgi:NAD(P)-dependent dehydrogenase (short-subunit alcohol dehydrogenase family)